MVTLILATLIAVALAGLVVKYFLQYRQSDARITWREFGIGMAASPLVAVLVVWVGWGMARNSLITFTEYWNGWETAAVKSATQCFRDSSCHWDYNCDPYIVMVSYECNCSTDSKGRRSCSTCTRPETRYHSCPYVDNEYHFYVDTTLGRYTIATSVFPDNPQAHRWRKSVSIPESVISSAGAGEPLFWLDVRKRSGANQPGPVTARREYANYILASEHTFMKEYSGDVADYKKLQLLPELSHNVLPFYASNKVYFVGWRPVDHLLWQRSMEYLNANFGYRQQGDLHLVVVKDEVIARNPDRYSLALKAYWQDKTVFRNEALSKNTVVVLVGTVDGATVSWSRAFTGMPLGNEKLTVVLRDGLKGIPLTYKNLIGPMVSQRDGNGIHYPSAGDSQIGLIQRVLEGWDDPSTKFRRISMSGKDSQGGFLYLKNQIQPTTGQMWGIFFVTFLLCGGVWVWAAVHRDQYEMFAYRRRRH